MQCTSLKLRPVVAGYRMDSLSFLSGPVMKTALAVRGMPALSISSGSSMPYLKQAHIILSRRKESPGMQRQQDVGKFLQCSDFPVGICDDGVVYFATRGVGLNILDPPAQHGNFLHLQTNCRWSTKRDKPTLTLCVTLCHCNSTLLA